MLVGSGKRLGRSIIIRCEGNPAEISSTHIQSWLVSLSSQYPFSGVEQPASPGWGVCSGRCTGSALVQIGWG